MLIFRSANKSAGSRIGAKSKSKFLPTIVGGALVANSDTFPSFSSYLKIFWP